MKKNIELIHEVVEKMPHLVALPVHHTQETQNGELGIRALPKLKADLYQTDKFLFRRPNHKKIV